MRGKVDAEFDDLGEQSLKNIVRPMRIYRIKLARAPDASLTALPLPDKPSLALLPFQNLSSDPEQEYFADGMVEEITTAIARLPWLFVIARNSAFTYKGKPVNVKQVAQELGVLRARRQRAQSREPGAHYQPADRHDDRRSHLGRPLRRRARRHF